jgi:hypothetical protein
VHRVPEGSNPGLIYSNLLERKAGKAGDISKESNAISDIGDYLTEMNIHFIFIFQKVTTIEFLRGFLLIKAWLIYNFINLFVFLALQPTVVVFSQPGSGL